MLTVTAAVHHIKTSTSDDEATSNEDIRQGTDEPQLTQNTTENSGDVEAADGHDSELDNADDSWDARLKDFGKSICSTVTDTGTPAPSRSS